MKLTHEMSVGNAVLQQIRHLPPLHYHYDRFLRSTQCIFVCCTQMHNIVFLSCPCFHTGRKGFPAKFGPFNMAAVNYFYLQLLAHRNKRMLDPVFFSDQWFQLLSQHLYVNGLLHYSMPSHDASKPRVCLQGGRVTLLAVCLFESTDQ